MMLNRREPVQDDSRFSAQATRMIELICVFMFVSVFENVFCVSPIRGWILKVILVIYFIEYSPCIFI